MSKHKQDLCSLGWNASLARGMPIPVLEVVSRDIGGFFQIRGLWMYACMYVRRTPHPVIVIY